MEEKPYSIYQLASLIMQMQCLYQQNNSFYNADKTE